MIDEFEEFSGRRTVRGNRNTRREPTPEPLFFTTNPTLPDLGSKSGRRGLNPETNSLSYITNGMVGDHIYLED
jgi:hypothetical protein